MNFNKFYNFKHLCRYDTICLQKRICDITFRIKPTRFIFRIEYLDHNQFLVHEIYPNNKYSKIDLFNKNKK